MFKDWLPGDTVVFDLKTLAVINKNEGFNIRWMNIVLDKASY